MVDQRRIRTRNQKSVGEGPVVYWMQRDQRIKDNWALVYAAEQSLLRKVPLMVLFNLVPSYGKGTLRHYDFMLKGLEEIEVSLAALSIPFKVLSGTPEVTIPDFVRTHGVGEVVVDFNPLRFVDGWRKVVGESLPVRLTEVDAHNIVPCWYASDKQEFAAYTFRPKMHRLLSEFLTPIPSIKKHPYNSKISLQNDWTELRNSLAVDDTVPSVPMVSGERAAQKKLREFSEHRLKRYHLDRNDPTLSGVSGLSPYLHFGQLSAQKVALTVKEADAPKDAKDAFLEELIVRRELSDNFCFYNEHYDQVRGAHAWAQATLTAHENDVREVIYTRDELEHGKTHDELWNAMQQQMVEEGKMHGWCRMYWAKKILEWSPDPQTAVDHALYLNDRYELDGNDPNGVVGVMWSICGVHDRAWNERPIFGKVRYMNFAGAKRKFDVKAYIETYGSKTTLFE